MVMLQFTETVCLAVAAPESATVAVKLAAPAVVGVPVMTPELVFRLNPAGSAPELIE